MVIDNKKAQSMSLTTILIMVLGVVVVVLLIWGFSSGWGSFWDTINPFTSGPNIDNIKSACNLACASGSVSKFCTLSRDVTLGNEKEVKGSCATLNSVGIASCSSIECKDDDLPKKCGEIKGFVGWKDDCEDAEKDKTSEVGDSEDEDVSKRKCCALIT